jgi:hypothetical protein
MTKYIAQETIAMIRTELDLAKTAAKAGDMREVATCLNNASTLSLRFAQEIEQELAFVANNPPRNPPSEPTTRYLALHHAGLRNGSFYRWTKRHNKWAQYINGDFMRSFAVEPTTYADQPLKEFHRKDAEKLIPRVCGGKG